MREGMFLGEHVLLSNKEWRACLRRVDARRAKKEEDKYVIRVKCPFCESGERDCTKCPLDVYVSRETPREWGCVTLFRLVTIQVGVYEKESPDLYDEYISWYANHMDNRAARKVLKYIYDGLLKMKKTNRRK